MHICNIPNIENLKSDYTGFCYFDKKGFKYYFYCDLIFNYTGYYNFLEDIKINGIKIRKESDKKI